MNVEIIALTDDQGTVVAEEWLRRAEAVHKQLRPMAEEQYAAKLKRVFAQGGRMIVATEGDRVLGVAVYRRFEHTLSGVKFYIDDLVTDHMHRSRGVGRALMTELERIARETGCSEMVLDSALERHGAHKFYYREGFVLASFNFKKRTS
jgi:hypothetical protein